MWVRGHPLPVSQVGQIRRRRSTGRTLQNLAYATTVPAGLCRILFRHRVCSSRVPDTLFYYHHYSIRQLFAHHQPERLSTSHPWKKKPFHYRNRAATRLKTPYYAIVVVEEDDVDDEVVDVDEVVDEVVEVEVEVDELDVELEVLVVVVDDELVDDVVDVDDDVVEDDEVVEVDDDVVDVVEVEDELVDDDDDEDEVVVNEKFETVISPKRNSAILAVFRYGNANATAGASCFINRSTI